MSGKSYSSGIAAYSQRPVEKPYLAVAANVNDSCYTTAPPSRKYNSSTHTNSNSANIITTSSNTTTVATAAAGGGTTKSNTPSTAQASAASVNTAAVKIKKNSMSNTNSTMTVNAIDAAAGVENNKTDASQGRRSGSKRTHEQAVTSDQQPQKNGVSEVPRKRQKVTYVLPHQNMEEGHFYVVLGEDIDVSTQRFKILSLLGEGTFGKVVEAWDRKRKEYCAVKIVRNVPKYTRDAKIEIQFMEKVRQADPNDRVPVMKIQRYFQNDTAHMCIVMPKYGPCLLDWIMKHGPFSHRHLAQIVFHCGVALDFFHSDLHLMHTDLKPENILMETVDTVTDSVTKRVAPPDPCRVRLCDLGGCCDERHSRTAIVSTRHYRSPEVILGLGWMYSTDMWSIGCILYELYTGKLLYDTHDNLEHLHLMERTLGRLPFEWAGRCGTEEARALFNTAGQLRSCTDPKHIARIARARLIQETVRDDHLLDLILGLLSYDRQRRLNARQMTTHPYVLKYYPEARKSCAYPDNRTTLRPPPVM